MPDSPRATSKLKLAVGVTVIAALALSSLFLPTRRWVLELAEWIRSAGATGVALYSGVYIASTLLFLPASVLSLAAGFAYGPLWGTLIVWPTATVAATLAFLVGRFLARDWVTARATRHPRFHAIDQAVGRRGLRIVFLLRLSPLVPFNLLNYTLGLTSLKFRHYLVGSLFGMLPGTIMYVYLGSLLTSVTQLASGHPSAGTAGSVLYWVGLSATVVVTVILTRLARSELRKNIGGDGDEPAGEAQP